MPTGDLVAGGGFTTAGGVAANRIARWNGSAWSALGSGMNGEVTALAVMPNGDLVAGGWFTTAGGVPANRVARWNGSAWSALGSGMNDWVYALAVMPSGDLLAGGNFTTAGGVAASRIARFRFDTPAITAHPQPAATCPGGTAAFSVAASPASGLSFRWRRGGVPLVDGPTPNGSIISGAASATLTISNVHPLDAGTYDALVANACGSVTGDPAALVVCTGDWNCDGVVDFNDFLAFLNDFNAQNPRADLNGDGAIDFNDFLAFLNHFNTPCP